VLIPIPPVSPVQESWSSPGLVPRRSTQPVKQKHDMDGRSRSRPLSAHIPAGHSADAHMATAIASPDSCRSRIDASWSAASFSLARAHRPFPTSVAARQSGVRQSVTWAMNGFSVALLFFPPLHHSPERVCVARPELMLPSSRTWYDMLYQSVIHDVHFRGPKTT
jgi:hypothetical protein